MSNDKNKKPPEEAAANNLYANIMLNYFNAAPPMHMDGTPVEDCPWEKEVKKALDSANPIEAFERLTDEDEHIDIPEDATEWRALIDKISSNPIFKELPFVAQQELQEQAAESLEEAKDALQVLEEFGERDKADRADVERQMLKQARKVLIDNTRLTVSTSTETKDGDAFLYRNLQEDPSSVAVVEGMMKGLITRAARAAAIPLAGYVSMGGQLLPRFTDKDKRKKQAATLKDMTAAVDAETVAAMILEAIPQTFGYFKEHAPERAATLEEYARQEAKAAFASIIEYVEAVNAEPVEEAAEGKKLSRAEQETKYGNTNLIPIDAHREPKDKLTQMLFGGKIKIGDVKKAINVNTDTKPVQTYLSVIPDPDFMEGIRSIYGKGDLCFSREHWRFYRAIMTEILQGNEWTTFQRLYQIEYHQLGRTRPGAISKEKEKEMMDMLYFFQKQFIEADITGEKAYYKKNADLQSMDDVPKGALVNFEIWPHYINHNKVDNAIHFLNIPILLKYALAHNHIATIPPKLFQNKAFKRQTEDASDVADMLIHWLMMKNVRNYELAYETVFNYMGVKSSDKTAAAKSRRTRLRNIVFKWMNYWSKELHLFSWDANNAQYIKIILPKDELEKKKHTLFTADKIKALM